VYPICRKGRPITHLIAVQSVRAGSHGTILLFGLGVLGAVGEQRTPQRTVKLSSRWAGQNRWTRTCFQRVGF
jgi:hypothetical protein